MKLDLNELGAVGDFFKGIWQDLVNKRLLPVVALLVVALIAVPIVLGRSGGSATPDAPIQTADANGDGKIDPVELRESRPGGQDRGGNPANPFKQANGGTSTSTTPTTPSGAGGGTSTTGSSTTPKSSSGTGTGKSDDKNSSGPSTAYKIDVTFGLAGQGKSEKNVSALTPFPSADDAYVVYLGAEDGGKTAVFLISTDVTPTGDGICDPSDSNCKQLEMRVGDTELFEVKDSGTGAALGSYELKLKKIHK